MSVYVNEMRPNTSVGAASPAPSRSRDEFASMTVGELRAVLEERGIKATAKAKKADLIELVEFSDAFGGETA